MLDQVYVNFTLKPCLTLFEWFCIIPCLLDFDLVVGIKRCFFVGHIQISEELVNSF